jgi:hypothetical protein
VLSVFCSDRHTNEREREKEWNVEEENTIGLLAGYMNGDPARRRKKRSIACLFMLFSLSTFFETTLILEQAGQTREHEKAPFVDLSHRTYIHIYIV